MNRRKFLKLKKWTSDQLENAKKIGICLAKTTIFSSDDYIDSCAAAVRESEIAAHMCSSKNKRVILLSVL